jgi:hypothetical protein
MGEMPMPGRLAVMLSALNRSPVLIGWVATSDLRAMILFFASLGLGLFGGRGQVFCPFSDIFVIGDDHSAAAGCDRFVAIEAENTDIPK